VSELWVGDDVDDAVEFFFGVRLESAGWRVSARRQ
jgi:hypothetical protein